MAPMIISLNMLWLAGFTAKEAQKIWGGGLSYVTRVFEQWDRQASVQTIEASK